MGSHLRAVHSVHIYENDASLIARLSEINATSMRLLDSALIIATAAHRERLISALEDVGVDARSCARDGRYTMFDARQLLLTFMRDGMPDSDLFRQSIGSVLLDARRRADSRSQGLIAFGEMVALLWQDGNKAAALKLEELWNNAMRDVTFHLHCAYPRDGFDAAYEIKSVHNLHTHIVQ
jgi:hypothetical protein